MTRATRILVIDDAAAIRGFCASRWRPRGKA